MAVDYLGIAADLKEALSFYSEAGGRGEPALVQDEAIALMQEKIQVLDGIMHGYDYHRYFTADTAQKLKIILESEDFILGIDQGERKPRFIRAVSSLSQSFALAVPHLLPWKTQPL
ncbi:type I restriction enzyme endonuclease domain-containing protein (plasmid) [Moraxella atlantae]|uniref:type I restriction enzyme endonuclease domain-containing protein n=1 Tax=Faucicola atlantae TaxID=34059 RepID=UPI00375286AF